MGVSTVGRSCFELESPTRRTQVLDKGVSIVGRSSFEVESPLVETQVLDTSVSTVGHPSHLEVVPLACLRNSMTMSSKLEDNERALRFFAGMAAGKRKTTS